MPKARLLIECDQEERHKIRNALIAHLASHSAIDVETGCLELRQSGKGTKLCISTTDNNRVMINFSGFLLSQDVQVPKQSIAVAQAFFKVKGIEDQGYNASHLCHNPQCVNHQHIVLEDAEYNRSRNFCCGGNDCKHEPKCIRPGVRSFIIQNKPKQTYLA